MPPRRRVLVSDSEDDAPSPRSSASCASEYDASPGMLSPASLESLDWLVVHDAGAADGDAPQDPDMPGLASDSDSDSSWADDADAENSWLDDAGEEEGAPQAVPEPGADSYRGPGPVKRRRLRRASPTPEQPARARRASPQQPERADDCDSNEEAPKVRTAVAYHYIMSDPRPPRRGRGAGRSSQCGGRSSQ